MTTDQAVAATRAANISDPAADDMRRLFNNGTAATTARHAADHGTTTGSIPTPWSSVPSSA